MSIITILEARFTFTRGTVITGKEWMMGLVGSFAPIHRDRDLGVPLPINYASTFNFETSGEIGR